ncbi:MAG: phage tail sheath C-terminal domain-containing protein [Anaerovoracaceae bacterium]|uniref:phage tail sheath C-terminal domain-containing protein n=1 Tax=Chryseobacterium sp. TaxID=1871047 RepID=UPI002FC8C326
MGLPEILINFKNKASTAIRRSSRGVVCLVIKDSTKETAKHEYKEIQDVIKEDWTSENYKIIEETILSGPIKVIVFRLGTDKAIADIKPELDATIFDWMCSISTDQTDVVAYVKARNLASMDRKIKAVTFKATAPDDEHVVNFVNEKIKRKSNASEVEGWKYLGRLTGILAAMPFTKSSTCFRLEDLERVIEPADVNKAINEGGFVIINDFGEPKIGRGVNSLTTIKETQNEDWKSIAIIEAMDLIRADIYESFKKNYVGQLKNKYENQCLFISSVNQYFDALTKEDILSAEYDNHAEIDLEAQKRAWVKSGVEEATSWSDMDVKKRPFKKQIFLNGKLMILDAMEDMVFNIGIV